MPSPSLQDTPAHANSFTQNLDNLGDDAANLFEDISKATFKIWVQLFFRGSFVSSDLMETCELTAMIGTASMVITCNHEWIMTLQLMAADMPPC
jgi:hypothetical protein